MDLVIENVGRRSSEWTREGSPTDVGRSSLNGYERNSLYWNLGGRRFVNVGYLTHSNRIEDGRGVAVADFDRDGRLDLLIQNLDAPAVLLMGRGEVGHWLQLELVGVASPRDPIGATVTVYAGDRAWTRQLAAGSGFMSSSSRVLHFGLGEAELVDQLEIRWPSGQRQTLRNIAVDQRLRIREGASRAVAADPR